MRVSVTDLESYRYYLASEDMTLDDILRRLRREEPPSPNMLAGTAFHKLLEDAPVTLLESGIETAEVDDFRFRFDLDAELALPDIREIKAAEEYDVNGLPVTLVGKVDALSGIRVDDHKLTGRFDAEKYTDSVQWRAYLMLFKAHRFTYNVFTGAPDKDGVWVIRAFDQLDLYRYGDMEKEVMALLADYVAFAAKHNIYQQRAA